MLRDVIWAEDRDYKTGSEDEPLQFYLDALCNSSTFDLLLGYFSSSALNVLSLGFASFIYSGGKMRAVINNVLSETDKDAIMRGQNKSGFSTLYNFNNIKELKSSLDEYGNHFFECFAWLIATDKIELKIIKPKEGKGIAHYKSGVFSDGENAVSYKSSCNFTYYGFVENLEELECRLSWDDNRSKKSVNKQIKNFEEIFSGNSDYVEYLKIEDVKSDIQTEFGGKDLKELLVQEKELLNNRKLILSNPKIKDSINSALDQLEGFFRIEKSPKFPYPQGPRPYQVKAYENWVQNGKRGLFAMATGTGKTLTSAYCLIKEYEDTKEQKNIIVVPGKELVDQWVEELKQCNFKTPIKWYSGNSKLNKDIDYINLLKQGNFTELNIVITYKSFSSDKFLNIFRGILKEFTVVFDETHNMGASGFMNSIRDLEFDRKIGLSATPLRLWDENDENMFIETFFDSSPPYTFSYSMEEAIKNGYLCKYKYEPFFVTFTDEEWDEYIELTKRIFMSGENEKINTIAALKRQLLKDKAEGKNDAVIEIIDKLVKAGSYKNTLVYCAKGTNEEDERNILALQDRIKVAFPTLNTAPFLGETKNRDLLLKDFEDDFVDMLLAIKCLDEGVNIPKTINAIFIASGQNYREFVQRRGRVLRNYKSDGFKKEFAYIYDIVLLPSLTQYQNHRETAKNLIVSEFRRLYEFYELSSEKFSTYKKINEALAAYGLTEGYIRKQVETKI